MKWLKERRFIWMIAVLVIILTTSIGMTAGGRSFSTFPEGMISGGFGSVSQFFYSASRYADSFFSYVSNIGMLRQQNQELEELVNEYKNMLTDYERMENENQSLKALLDFKEANDQYEYLSATVTAIDPDLGFNLVVLNRGAQDGVEQNMSVVVEEGLIGRVVEVSTFSCKVLVITDRNSMFSGVNVRTGSYVRITGEEEYLLKGYMDMDAEVEPGDIIVSSGLTGSFIPDLVIGEVLEVTTPLGRLEQEVLIEPSVDLEQIKHVLIIK